MNNNKIARNFVKPDEKNLGFRNSFISSSYM